MTAGKRDRAPPPMRREAACRLNAHRSFSMTDGMRRRRPGRDARLRAALPRDEPASLRTLGCGVRRSWRTPACHACGRVRRWLEAAHLKAAPLLASYVVTESNRNN